MPPVKTQVACPNCRTPIMTTLEQLFDVTQDPSAKNRFLSGRFNLINCPTCRYQGQIATLILYHDADKELLMSFVPMELGLPQAEQEKVIGKLMNEVINKLPQEKRKGYLLNPKQAFTLQGLTDRVLEGEGITREMVDSQKAKAQLIQQFLTTPEDQLAALVQAKDAELDYAFFQLFTASIEAQLAGGGQAGADRLLALRQKLLDLSSFGAESKRRAEIYEAALRELQAMGDKLTPDKLFEMIVMADNDDKVAAYASAARPALDYAFFEALTRRIDKAQGEAKERLAKRRDLLLQITQEMDTAAKAQMEEAAQTLRAIMEAPDLYKALQDNANRIDDVFMEVLNMNLEAAQKAGRPDLLQRLQLIHESILRLMQESAPPEIRFINELLQMSTPGQAEAAIRDRTTEVNQQLVDAMTYIVNSLRQNSQPQLADRLEQLQGVAIGQLMDANWKK